MRFSPIRLLLLLNVVLAAGLAWLWFDENGKTRELAWTPPAALSPELAKPTTSVDAATAGASAANPTQYVAVLERPLFAPDRRPPPPPAPPAAPPPPDPLANIQITGIFTGDRAGIIAIVDGKARRVRVNDTVGAWTLKGIAGRDVTFEQGSDSRQLRLNYSRLGPPVVQAAVSGIPPGGTSMQGGQGQAAASNAVQNLQDEGRERLRRRNEVRAARGLPLITE
jgi:hypothetical protein